jgi:hypothetical protein
MAEQDFVDVQRAFRQTVGVLATAEITKQGAKNSADVIVDLEGKLIENKTQPIHLMQAAIAASQLIERWGQQNQRVASGSIMNVNDEETLALIKEKMSQGNLSKEENMLLTARMYVADPKRGANKAMEVFSKLRALYPDIPLAQPLS